MCLIQILLKVSLITLIMWNYARKGTFLAQKESKLPVKLCVIVSSQKVIGRVLMCDF